MHHETKYLIACLFFAGLLSCSHSQKVEVAEGNIIDSFEVSGMEGMDDFLQLHFIDETTLVSFNTFGSELKTFTKSGKGFQLSKTDKMSVGKPFHSFWVDNGTTRQSHVVDGDNNYYRFDTAYRLESIARFENNKGVLNDQYIINGNKTIPILTFGDTIISTFYYKDYQDYQDYFKEPSIAEHIRIGDSLISLKTYFAKPDDLINHAIPFPKYCVQDNKIVLIYPCYDTLYVYDRSTAKTMKHLIGNEDYLKPKPWNYKKMYGQDFNRYFSQYRLHNFSYQAIFYSPLSKHFLLLYQKPVVVKNDDQNPVPEDQNIQLLVLNEDFERVARYQFTRQYLNPTMFFFYSEKGLVMPLANQDDNYSKTKCHVYAF